MKGFVNSLRYAAVLVVACWGTVTSAQEAGGSDLVLIMDGSNSMWGQIEGVNKIVIAREAVGGLVDELPDNANVGLVAYGHRRESDCEDIEVLSAIAPVDKEPLKTTINGITPKGKTPITASINSAVELAKGREGTAIVLISDGLETCGLDPCAAVRTARESGVPFVLHVIGFDVAGEDTAQLECAAQAGGGLYINAEDAEQLSAALESAYERPAEPDGALVVTATADGKLQDATVRVVDVNTNDEAASGRTYVGTETNPRRLALEDGSYRATVSAVGIKGAPSFTFDFSIEDGGQVERSFDFSAGEIALTVMSNGELSDASVRVYSDGKEVAAGRTYVSARTNPRVLRVAAGTYDVRVKSVAIKSAPERLFENVVVAGGERTELAHAWASGTLSVGVRRGETLVDATVRVIDGEGKEVGAGRTYTSASSNPRSFTLPPGDYTVRIGEIRGVKREVTFGIVAEENTTIDVDLDLEPDQ